MDVANEEEFDRLVSVLARRIAPVVRREIANEGCEPSTLALTWGLLALVETTSVEVAAMREHAAALKASLK